MKCSAVVGSLVRLGYPPARFLMMVRQKEGGGWRVSRPDRLEIHRRGAVLVEVVLALALFVAAAAVITGGMNASLSGIDRLRLNAHAADLAVSVLSELQMGTLAAEGNSAQEFDPPFEDWTWEAQLAPVDDDGGEEGRLTRVEVIIRHKDPPLVHRLNQVLRLENAKPLKTVAGGGGGATGVRP